MKLEFYYPQKQNVKLEDAIFFPIINKTFALSLGYQLIAPMSLDNQIIPSTRKSIASKLMHENFTLIKLNTSYNSIEEYLAEFSCCSIFGFGSYTSSNSDDFNALSRKIITTDLPLVIESYKALWSVQEGVKVRP